jgi:hypothetical protein
MTDNGSKPDTAGSAAPCPADKVQLTTCLQERLESRPLRCCLLWRSI